MKKYLFLAPLLTLTFVLTGCSGDVVPEKTPATDNTPTQATEPQGNVTPGTETTTTGDEDTNPSNENDDGSVTPPIKITIPPIKVTPGDTGINDQLIDPIVKPNPNLKVTLPVQDPIGPIPPLEKNNLPQL